ncbi:hypothetical protein [Altererythrobacter lauratis]|uniref:Lipoprotein n=1 Tax=Alteraurantiacibacter lauratis TaxID=2054627 RepID=A0ABV7EGF9_9SPHN
MRLFHLLACLPAALLLPSCVRTVADVVTAPVRAVGAAVDLATTSQSEADENRGREIRRREELLGRLQREYDEEARRCERGNDEACREAIAIRREIDALIPTIPAEPDRRRD